MPTQLVQTLTFANVANEATIVQAHDINIDGTSKAPDLVFQSLAGFSVTANSTQVSVTNNSGSTATISVWLQLLHSIPRVTAGTVLSPSPFIAAVGGGGGGGSTLFPISTTAFTTDFTAVMTQVNQITAVSFDTGNVTMTLPAASSVPNGTWTGVQIYPAASSNALFLQLTGPDQFNGADPGGPVYFQGFDDSTLSALFVSNGSNGWFTLTKFGT